MNTIRFEVEKVIQAAAVLLGTAHGRRMTRLRLLKLLYIADRESLAETESPITGDTVAAMDHGPVLSETYNLIKGEAFAAYQWRQYFDVFDQDVELKVDPGVDALSRYDVRKLREVAARFEHDDDYDIAHHTHSFEEWIRNQPPPRSSRPIELPHILEALGMQDDLEEILAEAKSRRSVDQAIARAGR